MLSAAMDGDLPGERATLSEKNCYLVVILFDFIVSIKFESATIQAEGF
jgi:hypothetical protein